MKFLIKIMKNNNNIFLKKKDNNLKIPQVKQADLNQNPAVISGTYR